ncbi:glycosyltransferase family 4 protein [Paenibacillus tarimensis]
MSGHILYIRNFANKVNPSAYNLQEIGFGKALVRIGYNCDIVYFNDENNTTTEVVYQVGDTELRIIWMKGIKFLSNSIYIQLLNSNYLNKYDFIITTEYNQIMTYLLTLKYPNNLVLYHGPYKDNNNLLIRKIYDTFFLPRLIKKIKYIFVKSDMAKEYLLRKGFYNAEPIGVGLDCETLGNGQNKDIEIDYKLRIIRNKKVLLYIGVLEDRRNIIFLLKIFKRLLETDPDLYLIIVGDGKTEDTSRYWEYVYDHNIKNNIVHFSKIEQKNLWQIYEVSDLMIFPTQYDIFGMVLLESIFFQVPVVTSVNGGSSTLFENKENGIVIDHFNEDTWVDEVNNLLQDTSKLERIKHQLYSNINNITWDHIADKALRKLMKDDVFEKSAASS